MPRKKQVENDQNKVVNQKTVDGQAATDAAPEPVKKKRNYKLQPRETREQASARAKKGHAHRQYISYPNIEAEMHRLTDEARIAVDSTDESGNVQETALQTKPRKKLYGSAAWPIQPTVDGQSPTETAKTIRLSLASLDLPPINFADPEQVKNRIVQYLEFCEENDRMPSLVGMANWLGVPRQTLQKWKRGDVRSETHTPIIQQACNIMEEMLVEYFQRGKMNPAAGIFLLKNMFQYRDVQDVVVSPKNPIGDAQQQKQLEDKYLDIVESDD